MEVKLRRTLSFLFFCLLINHSAGSIDESIKQKIDDMINNIVGCRDIIGMNVAIVYGGETVYTQGYGVIDRQTNTTVTPDTFFGIASTSKAFTTTLLGKILQQQNLTWDTPVREILGEDFYFSDGLRSTRATLRDLAAHTMGLPSYNYMRMQDPTRAELAQKLRFVAPSADLRTSFQYNNLMYGLLSHVTEMIGGATWEELLTDEIFQPTGMDQTTFTHVANLTRDDIAKPYLIDFADGEWKAVSLKLHSEWGQLGGSGSVLSSANQMAEWIHLQLNQGLSQSGVRVVEESVMEETHHPVNGHASTPDYLLRPNVPVTFDYSKYALGWRTGFYRGLPIFTHTGTSWGYGALLTLFPDMGLGIHTSVTGPDDSYLGRRAAQMYIADLLLGEEPFLDLTTACTFPAPWTEPPVRKSKYNLDYKKGLKSRNPLELYEGTFGNFGFGNITVAENSSTGLLQMGLGHLGVWNLHPRGAGHLFAADGIDDIWPMDFFVEFASKDPEGCPTCIDLLNVSFDSVPTVFERDLNLADAPLPPPVGCDEVYTRDGGDTSGQSSVLTKSVAALYAYVTQHVLR